MARPISKREVTQRHTAHHTRIIAIILLCAVLYIGFQRAGHNGIKAATPAPKTIAPVAGVQLSVKATTDQQLATVLSSWAAKQPFASSVVVQHLTGTKPLTASYQPTSSIVTASTFKIYIAYAMLHGVEQGQYTMGMQLNDGNTLQTDLTNMIINSDNPSSRTLGFLYGWKNANALLAAQGISHTNLYNYVPPSTAPVGDKYTTAADLTLFLDKLYTGKLLNAANTTLLLSLMKQQTYRERIPAGVPNGVAIADKPGWLTGDDDAAIVYGPKSTYILVVMSKGSTTAPLADLSQQVYAYLQN